MLDLRRLRSSESGFDGRVYYKYALIPISFGDIHHMFSVNLNPFSLTQDYPSHGLNSIYSRSLQSDDASETYLSHRK